MDATKDHPEAPRSRTTAKFQAAKCVGGVDPDADDIARLESIRIKTFQRFVAY
jgi:hypothetical protein